MRIFKRILATLLAALLTGILLFNFSLYFSPRYKTYEDCRLNKGLIEQLRFLKEELHQGAGQEMQQQYPEGFVFLNALYCLSWIEVAAFLPEDHALFTEAHSEISWGLAELTSEAGKRPFEQGLQPEFGIFYRGWTNYVLGKKLAGLTASKRDSTEIAAFQQNCADIIEAVRKQESPFLESYRRACWPADMVGAMASVAIHDKLFKPSYSSDLKIWLKKIEANTDSLGLIPHASDCSTGSIREAARGSSQSLILHFLLEIDPAYAKEKFLLYREHFLTRRLGLPAIREYPKGLQGTGDIDSGPVIWGIGGAASIVGQRVMGEYGDFAAAIGLRNSIETFGLGRSKRGKKNYLRGKVPIADAFIAWANSPEAYEVNRWKTRKNWRIRTQFFSLILLSLGGWGIVRLWKMN